MKNQNENAAVSDVTARMREEASILSLLNGQSVGVSSVVNKLREFADSIEAAAKREKAAIEADALAVGGAVGGMVEAARHKPSNAAAMREALEAARDLLLPRCNGGTAFARVCGETVNKIMDALSAPPRNCDVGTAEEQEVRFKRFCESHWDLNNADSTCAECPLKEKAGTECEFAWAQMPYKEKEGAE